MSIDQPNYQVPDSGYAQPWVWNMLVSKVWQFGKSSKTTPTSQHCKGIFTARSARTNPAWAWCRQDRDGRRASWYKSGYSLWPPGSARTSVFRSTRALTWSWSTADWRSSGGRRRRRGKSPKTSCCLTSSSLTLRHKSNLALRLILEPTIQQTNDGEHAFSASDDLTKCTISSTPLRSPSPVSTAQSGSHSSDPITGQTDNNVNRTASATVYWPQFGWTRAMWPSPPSALNQWRQNKSIYKR